MTTGYSRTPKVLKGALIELSEPFLGPVPNIIPFQYNPEKMTRTLTPGQAEGGDSDEGTEGGDPLAQPADPEESIRMTIEFDATDDLEQPESNPVAALVGVADRLAAMEKLLYPVSEGLLGGLGAAVASLFGADIVPRRSAPVVLLVWGPGRILPVRLTRYQVDEEAFSTTLYPVMAKVTLDLKVLTPEHFERPGRTLTGSEQIAVTAYRFTMAQREVIARAGLLANVDAILGMLPF